MTTNGASHAGHQRARSVTAKAQSHMATDTPQLRAVSYQPDRDRQRENGVSIRLQKIDTIIHAPVGA